MTVTKDAPPKLTRIETVALTIRAKAGHELLKATNTVDPMWLLGEIVCPSPDVLARSLEAARALIGEP